MSGEADHVGFGAWAGYWVDTNLPMIEAKAKTYGSNSLAAMGHLFAKARGVEVTDERALELGCMLYAYGKMQRWIDAALHSQEPARDTLDDLAIYTLMARFINETGNWP